MSVLMDHQVKHIDQYNDKKNILNGILISSFTFAGQRTSNDLCSYNLVDTSSINSNIINSSIYTTTPTQAPSNPIDDSDQISRQPNLHATTATSLLNLEPNMSIFQMSNDIPNLDLCLNQKEIPSNYQAPNNDYKCHEMTSVVTLTDPSNLVGQLMPQEDNKTYIDLKNCFKKGV